MSDLPEDQRRIFDFLLEHLITREPFTKDEMLGVVETWREETKETYWSKVYTLLLSQLEDGRFRVGNNFRKYTTPEKFKKLTTQTKKVLRINYQKVDYDKVIIFEFFMPLVNERYLRDSLDTLFYKDTILPQLKNLIKEEELKYYFPPESDEGEDEYYNRVCNWISEKFIGYSIMHVSGRFRNEKLRTLSEAADLQIIGRSYLIDETTAIVKFIFPVGQKKTNPDHLDYLENRDQETEFDAERIRWLFNVLFIYNIIELVGEDEIWMVESGMRNQLHIWRAANVS